MIPFRAFVLISALTALGGCGALSAFEDAATPLDAYELRAPAEGPVAARNTGRDLVIEVPDARGALDTDRIMIRPNALQAQYLPGVRWTDDAPVMVQTLMLRAFENANALRYVGRRPLGSSGDYALVSELTDFQAEFGPGGTVATRVRLTARLVRESDAAVLASRTFQAAAPAASTDPLDVALSFNAATDALLPELVGWVLGRLGARLSG